MKRLILAICLFFSVSVLAFATNIFGVSGKITTILNTISVTGASDTYQFSNAPALRNHKVSIVPGASSVGTATVLVEVNDNPNLPWYAACTLAISSAAASAAACTTEASWPYMRHNVTAMGASAIQLTSTVTM